MYREFQDSRIPGIRASPYSLQILLESYKQCRDVSGCAEIPASDPEEDVAVVLHEVESHEAHFLVGQRSVGELHVDLPRRGRHDHRELAEHVQPEPAQVALDPLHSTQDTGHTYSSFANI